MIKLLRIDDRLIHGQVAFAWVNVLKTNLIVVANDRYAENAMLKMALNIGKPSGIDMKVMTLDDSIDFLETDIALKRNIFLVVETTQDARYLVEKMRGKGMPLNFSVNIGGIRPVENEKSKLIFTQVYLSDKDIENLNAINGLNMKIFAQDVPSNNQLNYKDVLTNYNN